MTADDASLFRTSELEASGEIRRQLERYDRLLQTIAFLAFEPSSQQRALHRQTLLVHFKNRSNLIGGTPTLSRRNGVDRDIDMVADQIWALVDSSCEITPDIIAQLARGMGGGFEDKVNR